MAKGSITLLEMAFTVVLLFVSMQIFFPAFRYTSNWYQVGFIQKSRDLSITMDRAGVLYKDSFSAQDLSNFLNAVIPTVKTNLIGWSETEGTLKGRIIVACNCTQGQIDTLNNWFGNLKVNGRDIRILIVSSALEDINNPEKQADALFIWGYKPITAAQQSEMQKFLNDGKGILEMADITVPSQIDSAQTRIFGLKYVSSSISGIPSWDYFTRAPSNSQDIIYTPYKYFYHIPLPIVAFANTTASVPVRGVSSCSDLHFTEGNFTFNSFTDKFWICNMNSVYFDTNQDGTANVILQAGNNFKINNYNFTLSYINGNQSIGIQFNQNFRFQDFVKDPLDFSVRLYPEDNNAGRVLIQADKVFTGTSTFAPVVILNRTGNVANTAWIADFTSDFGIPQDDKRLLLMSLVLSSSNKKAIQVLQPSIKVGYVTSYVNVVNDDVFEVYKFNLGLGNPF